MPVCLKVEEAGREGAELILLPEDGIHGYGFTRYKVEQKITGQQIICRETIPGFLEPLLGEGENPCQLLEQLEDAEEELEAWYQKYYAQVLHNAFILSLNSIFIFCKR